MKGNREILQFFSFSHPSLILNEDAGRKSQDHRSQATPNFVNVYGVTCRFLEDKENPRKETATYVG